MYELLLFGHLLGVALLLAGLGAHTVAVERMRQAATTSELAILLSIAERGGRLVLVGGPILIVAGLTLAIRYWSLTDGWIAAAIGLVLVQGIVGSLADRRLRVLRESLDRRHDPPSDDLPAFAGDRVLHASNGLSVAVIAEILLLMTIKPAGWATLWSVAAMVLLSALSVWRASRIGATASRAD